MTREKIIREKISKYQRKLERVREKSIFYKEASEYNKKAGRKSVSDVQRVQANYYNRQEVKFREIISDLEEIAKIL